MNQPPQTTNNSSKTRSPVFGLDYNSKSLDLVMVRNCFSRLPKLKSVFGIEKFLLKVNRIGCFVPLVGKLTSPYTREDLDSYEYDFAKLVLNDFVQRLAPSFIYLLPIDEDLLIPRIIERLRACRIPAASPARVMTRNELTPLRSPSESGASFVARIRDTLECHYEISVLSSSPEAIRITELLIKAGHMDHYSDEFRILAPAYEGAKFETVHDVIQLYMGECYMIPPKSRGTR